MRLAYRDQWNHADAIDGGRVLQGPVVSQHTVYSRPRAAVSSSLFSLMSEGDIVLTDLGVEAAARELHRRY